MTWKPCLHALILRHLSANDSGSSKRYHRALPMKKITIIIERKLWQFIQQSDFAQAINLNSLWFQMNSRYVIKYYKFTSWTWTKNCQLEINRNSRSEKEGTPQRINLLSLKNNQCQASILDIYPCTQGFGLNLVIWSEHKWNGLIKAVILQSNNF